VPPTTTKPDWQTLYGIAAYQEGHFSTAQAAEAGFSPQLLAHHLRSGRIRRIRRAVYRLNQFPEGDHEDLVVVWLWSDQRGVFSHETALYLHDLSDALPAKIHLTLPSSWSSRRLRVPRGVMASFADVPDQDRSWVGCLPVTKARRTLEDCAEAAVSPELIAQALAQARDRGLLDRLTAAHIRRQMARRAK
jgi:predicted transcriptional regulator of viral defense system